MPAEHRTLRFETVDEALAEAERLSAISTRTTGHFGHGQIIDHLARTLDVTTGKTSAPTAPILIRIFVRVFRNRILNQPAKPGIQLPPKAQSVFWSETPVDVEEAMEHLRRSAADYQSLGQLPKHPFFGDLSREQHDKLQCRHFELHLGFVHPA